MPSSANAAPLTASADRSRSATQIHAITAVEVTKLATFSLVIACLVKTRERFMGIGQILTMPLFFASNAIYCSSCSPG
ncbi:MAG TPA: hypothetical protein VFT22_28220 [Kofleriaceae bacterium]|nr:hypothetical protein [Kofleriaceae bacterium]